ncbi:MAG: 4Fe-4S cluster-binding domain-containing protein, partial [Bacteroidales bacterium]|nr:4Fe-4S cluster-binding domain-containing protein [Bacteroidales bacterium]
MNYSKCDICPHNCKVNRKISSEGFCKSSDKAIISSVCVHKGEEPVISGKLGICNVFFAHCNLQCVFCQNFQISRNFNNNFTKFSVEEITKKIIETLKKTENIVGFVSPSHFVPFVIKVIDKIREFDINPIFVYNSNGYDSVESLELLENKINVYMPDFKYSDDDLAFKLSGIKNYTQTALNAIKEMYRQKGSSLFLNEKSEIVESGLIVRHLLLPGFVEQSKNVLKLIAEEISTSLNISLMSQYFPPRQISEYESLNCRVSEEEYNELIDKYYELGFYKGWIQELS